MSTIFIANTSPADVQKRDDGMYHVPLIDKTLAWIVTSDVEIDHVVLFISQDHPYGNDEGYPADFAAFITDYVDRAIAELGPEEIEMMLVEEETTDYDIMLKFYQEKLSDFADYNEIYMEVTGGTAAMSFVLLWQGITQFGERVTPLRVSPAHDEPLPLDIGRLLLLDHEYDDYKDLIALYQYHAAFRVLENNKGLFHRYWRYFDAIRAVTKHARQRINFNFEEAETSLRDTKATLPKPFRDRLEGFITDLDERDDAWILREEIYATAIALDNGEFKDALTSIITFREGLMRAYVVKLGIPLRANNRKFDKDWLANPSVWRNLHGYVTKRLRLDETSWLNTRELDKILEYLGQGDDAIKVICDRIDQFNKLSTIRNNAIHHFKGVSEASIDETFPQGYDAIIPEMHSLYTYVTERPVRVGYYDEINAFILDLIVASKRP